jgi:hypothetical protein
MKLLVLALAYPMLAETFAERWPEPVAVDPAPIIDPYPVQRQPQKIRHAEHFVCHRQTYYEGRHRYWRCKR